MQTACQRVLAFFLPRNISGIFYATVEAVAVIWCLNVTIVYLLILEVDDLET